VRAATTNLGMPAINPAHGLFVASLLLASCNDRTTVKFELTDAPPELASIAQVVVSLDRVEAHVAGDDDDHDPDGPGDRGTAGEGDGDRRGGWRTITPRAGTFDLMALRNDVRAALGELELTGGKITQIRLFINPEADNRVVLVSGESCALDLEHVPPTGVKIIHPFKALEVNEGSSMTIVIDFDAGESLDQTGACAFALKPVIKIKRIDQG
jgi:hypothetical protein